MFAPAPVAENPNSVMHGRPTWDRGGTAPRGW